MDKKFYWLKLKDDFFNSDEVMVIRSKKNGAEYIIFWQQLLLKAITSKEVGVLRFTDRIPYDTDMLSTITNTNVDIVRTALKIFQELGMIDIKENGDIWIESIGELVGSETKWAIKKRKQRLKLEGDNVPLLSQNCPTEIEKELEKEIELDIEKEKDNKKGVKLRNIIPPKLEDVKQYISDNNYNIDVNKWFDFYTSKGWVVGKTKMKDWQACVRTWLPENKEGSTNVVDDLNYNKVEEI